MIHLISRGLILKLVAAASVALFLIVLRFYPADRDPPIRYLSSLSITLTIDGALLWLLGRNWCWRWIWKRFPALSRRIFPDLNGVWSGEILSDYEGTTRIPATLLIRQSLFTLTLSMETEGMKSTSRSAKPTVDPGTGDRTISYYYEARKITTPDHDGAAVIEVRQAKDGLVLRGRYFNSKKNAGNLYFLQVDTDPESPRGEDPIRSLFAGVKANLEKHRTE